MGGIIEKLKETLIFLTGGIYIPKALRAHGRLIIHISDTPLSSYDALRRVFRVLKPVAIFHTGDLVDNIKLEMDASFLPQYRRHLAQLDRTFDCALGASVFYNVGNHDDLESLSHFREKYHEIEDKEVIDYGGYRFALSHYYPLIKDEKADFYFFGHNLDMTSKINEDGSYTVNGIEQIFIYDLDNKQYHTLKYPIGTDDSRRLRMRIGI